jgi:hypothetical protein
MCIDLPCPHFRRTGQVGVRKLVPPKARKSAPRLPASSNNRTGWGTHPQNPIVCIFSSLEGVCQEFWRPKFIGAMDGDLEKVVPIVEKLIRTKVARELLQSINKNK